MSSELALARTVQRTGVYRCLECGKCTAVCPISQHDHRFSPRRTVGRALMRRDEKLLADDRLWACLTCLHCSQVCPAGVAYSDLTLGVRTEAHKLGLVVNCTHSEVIHAWMRMMTDPALKQDRLGWLGNGSGGDDRRQTTDDGREQRAGFGESRIANRGLQVSADSDVLYFVGCAPHFEVQFGHIGVAAEAVARATVQTLNALGIKPQVLADERCCGHDLLWEGDLDSFRQLAELNAVLIRESGAKRVVTSCPECARTLKLDYPTIGIELNVDVLHLSELAAAGYDVHAKSDDMPRDASRGPGPRKTRVTYHDPCRLGRHLGVYGAPRQLLEQLGLELVEMPRHAENALCCGTNGWTHCGAANKEIQVERLREAQATGADVLVTACLKCQIHFRCAMQDREFGAEMGIEIKDLSQLLAEALG